MGRPWPRMWQALPLSWRTSVGRTLARARWTAPIRAIAKPVPAFVLFNANMLLWHIPGAYNLTLNHQWIHNCEHALFFFTGLLFWAHVVDPGPLRQRMSWYWRAIYITGAMIAGWVLAITLVLAKHPLYPHYAHLLTRPRRNLSAHRPADRRWDDVGTGLCFLLDRATGHLLSLGQPRQ